LTHFAGKHCNELKSSNAQRKLVHSNSLCVYFCALQLGARKWHMSQLMNLLKANSLEFKHTYRVRGYLKIKYMCKGIFNTLLVQVCCVLQPWHWQMNNKSLCCVSSWSVATTLYIFSDLDDQISALVCVVADSFKVKCTSRVKRHFYHISATNKNHLLASWKLIWKRLLKGVRMIKNA